MRSHAAPPTAPGAAFGGSRDAVPCKGWPPRGVGDERTGFRNSATPAAELGTRGGGLGGELSPLGSATPRRTVFRVGSPCTVAQSFGQQKASTTPTAWPKLTQSLTQWDLWRGGIAKRIKWLRLTAKHLKASRGIRRNTMFPPAVKGWKHPAPPVPRPRTCPPPHLSRLRRAPTAPLKLSCLKPYTSGVSSALDARAWRNGRRSGLEGNLSARWETGDAELPKFGEPCHMAIPSQARPEPSSREGVETRRAAPNPGSAGHGEGIVQTANPASAPGRRKP